MSSLIDLQALFSYFDAEIPAANDAPHQSATHDASQRNASNALASTSLTTLVGPTIEPPRESLFVQYGDTPSSPAIFPQTQRHMASMQQQNSLDSLLPRTAAARPIPPPRRRHVTQPVEATKSAEHLLGSGRQDTEEEVFHEVPEINDKDLLTLQNAAERQYITSSSSSGPLHSSLSRLAKAAILPPNIETPVPQLARAEMIVSPTLLDHASLLPTRPVSPVTASRPATEVIRASHIPSEIWFAAGTTVADALLSFFHAYRVPRIEQGLWDIYLDMSEKTEAIADLPVAPRFEVVTHSGAAEEVLTPLEYRKRLLPSEKLKNDALYIFSRVATEDDMGALLAIKVQEWETTWSWRQKVDIDIKIEELILRVRDLMRDRGQGGEGVWELGVEDADGEVEILSQSHFTELLEAGNKAKEVVKCVLRHPRASGNPKHRSRILLPHVTRSADVLSPVSKVDPVEAEATREDENETGKLKGKQTRGALVAHSLTNLFMKTAMYYQQNKAVSPSAPREVESKNALIGHMLDRLRTTARSTPQLYPAAMLTSPLPTTVPAQMLPSSSSSPDPLPVAPEAEHDSGNLLATGANTNGSITPATSLSHVVGTLMNALAASSPDKARGTPSSVGVTALNTAMLQEDRNYTADLPLTPDVKKIGKLANLLGLDTESAISSLKQAFEHSKSESMLVGLERSSQEKPLPIKPFGHPSTLQIQTTRAVDNSLDDTTEGSSTSPFVEHKMRTKKLVDFFGVRTAEQEVNAIRHLLEKKDMLAPRSADADKKTFLCRIYFANLTYKSLKLAVTADADEVTAIMMKRLGLADDPSHYAVFEQNQHLHHERQLDQNEILYQVTLRWQGQETFLFRRKAYRERVDQVEDDDKEQDVTSRSNSLSAKRSAKLAGFFGSSYALNEQGEDVKSIVDPEDRDAPSVSMNDFECLTILGKGKFGKVMQCRMISTNQIYAIKVISKAKMDADTINNSKAENAILRSVKHPFIIELHYAFQSPERLYLVMEFIGGGELYFHVNRYGRLGDTRARFYAAEIFLAMQCLHDKGIIYRDLKLENILLNVDGHIKITDFGLSQRYEALALQPEMANTPLLNTTSTDGQKRHVIAGTLEYLSPEVLAGQRHSFASDWWAFGVVVYEMLCATHPFYSADRHQLFQNIILRSIDYPSYLSPRAINFLQGLFVRNPLQRLGSQNAEEDGKDIQEHAYFSVVDFAALLRKEVKPTFIPKMKDDLDVAYFDPEFTHQQVNFTPIANSELQDVPANAFENFTFQRGNPLL